MTWYILNISDTIPGQDIAVTSVWYIKNIPDICWFGMVLVHRPRTNNVLAMYWVSTSPFAPSVYGVRPEIWGIHLWGSQGRVRSLTTGKLDLRGREGRFVGYNAESKGCRVYWTDSRTIGVERNLIFEDRPMDNELVFLPKPSVTKNRPRVTPTIRPPSNEPTSTTPEAPRADADISLSDIPLPQPDDTENATAIPESLTPAVDVTTEHDSSQTDAHDVNPHARRSTRVRKPSPYVRRILAGEDDGGTAKGKSRFPKGLQAPTGLAAIGRGVRISHPIHLGDPIYRVRYGRRNRKRYIR
jgi:hypothetical protein